MNADERRRFRCIAAAGVLFQGGSTAVDSGTIIAALVYQLSGSAIAVGAVSVILRLGWLIPQLVVGYLAQRAGSSLRYFMIGSYGRATCLVLLAVLLVNAARLSTVWVVAGFFVCWTAYAFVSGIVAVPYNDTVARSVPSERRSRLLAIRFFGGGVLGLGAAALADVFVTRLAFPTSYAAVAAVAAFLMYVSATLFILPGEPACGVSPSRTPGFSAYLRDGLHVVGTDRRFRLFVVAQWAGALNLMALPFYLVVAVDALRFDIAAVAMLLGAQTAGALAANALWGWWGDRYGKHSLLQGVAVLRMLPPAAILSLLFTDTAGGESTFLVVCAVFFVIGALQPGVTIAVLGFLMDVSPEARRPAYSGYFSALTAPAYLLPLLGGALLTFAGASVVFALAALGAAAQLVLVHRMPWKPQSTE